MKWKRIVVDDDVHARMKEYCKKHGYKLNKFTERLIDDYLRNVKSQKNNENE